MTLPIVLFIVAILISIPMLARARRNTKARKNLEAESAPALMPLDRIALGLAYPNRRPEKEAIHEIEGKLEHVMYGPSDRRNYVGDLRLLLHDSLVDHIDMFCRARVVMIQSMALVLELNGERILPMLIDADTPADADDPRIVRFLGCYRERQSQTVRREQATGFVAGCLSIFFAALFFTGILIIMLALPLEHPIIFGIGCLLTVWGAMIHGVNLDAAEGETLYRLRGRVTVVEDWDDLSEIEYFQPVQGEEMVRQYRILVSGGDSTVDPVTDWPNRWPDGMIGHVRLHYPEHWIDWLRRQTPVVAEVVVDRNGNVVKHDSLSLDEELKRFPPVEWTRYVGPAVTGWAILAIAFFNDVATPLDLFVAADVGSLAWFERLPGVLALIAAVVICGIQSGRLALAWLLKRRRHEKVMRWMESG